MTTVPIQTAAVSPRGNDVEGEVLTGRVLNVTETGASSSRRVPGNLYGYSNHYIRNSRDYVGGHPLTTYIYFYFMPYFYVAVVTASFLSPLQFYLAIACFFLNLFFFFFYIQHMYVNVKTMRYVLQQPGLPNHLINLNNAGFLEISLQEFAEAYAATKDAGFGIVSKEKQTVKIQVFKNSTKAKMRKCVLLSCLSFFTSILLLVYCVSWPLTTGFGNIRIHWTSW